MEFGTWAQSEQSLRCCLFISPISLIYTPKRSRALAKRCAVAVLTLVSSSQLLQACVRMGNSCRPSDTEKGVDVEHTAFFFLFCFFVFLIDKAHATTASLGVS